MMIVPKIEITISRRAVQTAAKAAALSAPYALLLPFAILEAATHDTMNAINTRTYNDQQT